MRNPWLTPLIIGVGLVALGVFNILTADADQETDGAVALNVTITTLGVLILGMLLIRATRQSRPKRKRPRRQR